MQQRIDSRSLWTVDDATVLAVDRACVLASVDFPAAVADLRSAIEPLADAHLEISLQRHLATNIDKPGVVGCIVYLVADARSVEAAVRYGHAAARRGCRDESFFIAFAKIIDRSGDKGGAATMLLQHAGATSSTGLLAAVADLLRNAGRGWQVEHFLSGLIAVGRLDLRVRLAEHYIEFRLWPFARDTLLDFGGPPPGPYPLYLLGRAGVGLLLEEEVIAAVTGLSDMPDPGPKFADALSAIWSWRVDAEKPTRPSGSDYPPLIARDLVGMSEGSPDRGPTRLSPSRLVIDPSWRGRITALSVGPQRTASTWLWQQFGMRSDVYAPESKEAVGFYDHREAEKAKSRVSDPIELDYWRGPTRNVREYLGIFDRDKRVRIDFSPGYAELPEATVQVIRKILGSDTRIIVGARDPVERAWSHLKFDLKLVHRALAELSLDDRLAHYDSVISRVRGDFVSAHAIWRRNFDRVTIVYYDDVVSRPDELVAEMEEFLGVAAEPSATSHLRANPSTPETMPVEDRAYLFSLYEHVYDAAEELLGHRVAHWRRRQAALIGGETDIALAS